MSLKDISDWCFSFVTLFNLQGARRRLALERNVFYLTTFLFVCQALFSTFFKALSCPASLPTGSLRQLAYSTRIGTVCQALSFAFYQVFSGACLPNLSFADSSVNIPNSSRFVNTFFQIFSSFFSLLLFSSPAVRSIP